MPSMVLKGPRAGKDIPGQPVKPEWSPRTREQHAVNVNSLTLRALEIMKKNVLVGDIHKYRTLGHQLAS